MTLPPNFVPCKPASLNDLNQLNNYPYLIQPKYDGLRCLITNGELFSNTLKPFPNTKLNFYFHMLKEHVPQSLLDGEIILQGKTLQDIQSVVMSHDGDCNGLMFVCFDRIIDPLQFMATYDNRLGWLNSAISLMCYSPYLMRAPTTLAYNQKDIERLEEDYVRLGFEGIIIRHRDNIYKFGRATEKEDSFWKFKRVEDAEAKILTVKQLERNNNDMTRDERGYAKRSSAKNNKEKLEIAGSLEVIGVNGRYKDKIFYVSLGSCTLREREWHWENRDKNEGRIITYKYAKHRGTEQSPAEPRFKGFRFEV